MSGLREGAQAGWRWGRRWGWAGAAAGIGLTLLAALPAPIQGQTLSGGCNLSDNFNSLSSREVSPGIIIRFISRADLRCPDGLRIRSDSAVIYEASGRNELLGNVRFTTSERDLRADEADWYGQEGRLLARGSVVFGDLVQGTEVRGDSLTYLEGREGRDEQVIVIGGRPSAVLPSDDGGESFTVTANRLRFQGERFFWGDGDVDVDRADLTAESDSLVYDRDEGVLILNRNALLVRGEVTARGGTLNLGFEEDRLRSLVARNGGEIETAEFLLTGLEVEIMLGMEEELESLVAQGGDLPDGGGAVLAVLESDDLRLHGDRVTVEDEAEGTRVLRASGNARAEALGAGFGGEGVDMTGAEEDAASADDAANPGLADRDWLEGEEIEAHFEADGEGAGVEGADGAPLTGPGDDGAEDGRAWRLVRLESTTNARALYRSPPQDQEVSDTTDATGTDTTGGDVVADSAAAAAAQNVAPPQQDASADPAVADATQAADRNRWPISYILADRIIIYLEAGDVRLLEAEGNVRGLQLEPRQGEAG